ncbi:MAG: HAMP domain-containing protein, partial [Caldilineae bacterium]
PDILGLALVTQDGQVLSLREQDAGRSLFASPAPDLNLAQVASGTVYWADGATPHLLLVGPWVEGAMPVRAVADLPLAGWVELQPFLLAKEGGYVYLVDDQGRLLHASTPAPMPMGADLRTIPEVADFLQGQDEGGEPFFMLYTGLLGTETMGVQTRVESLGWGVVVEIPAESILSRLTRMKQTLYGLTLLSVLIGVVLGGLATAWMVRPVSRLVQVARRLGAGDLSARASDFPNNEVGVLAAAFNQMAESIQAGRASLAASERRYRTLTDNLPDIVFRVRLQPEPFIEYISPAVVRILGISPESCYGPPNVAFRHIHPDDREKLLDLVADPKQMTRSFTLRWRRPDGVVVWMEHHVTVMTDDSGAVVAVEGVARDITRRLQDQQRIQRTNALAAALNQVVSRLLRAETPERVLDILVQELAALRIHTFVLLFDEPQPFDRVVEASTPPLRVAKVQVSEAAQRLISSTLGSRLYHVHLQVTEGGVLHRFLLNRT